MRRGAGSFMDYRAAEAGTFDSVVGSRRRRWIGVSKLRNLVEHDE